MPAAADDCSGPLLAVRDAHALLAVRDARDAHKLWATEFNLEAPEARIRNKLLAQAAGHMLAAARHVEPAVLPAALQH